MLMPNGQRCKKPETEREFCGGLRAAVSVGMDHEYVPVSAPHPGLLLIVDRLS